MIDSTPKFEYQQAEIEFARQEYLRALERPWAKRGKGIPHDWVEGTIILITFAIWIPLVVTWLGRYEQGSSIYRLSVEVAAYILIYVPLAIFGTKAVTRRHVLRKYPAIQDLIHSFEEIDEIFDGSLPVLVLDGRKYFLIVYHLRAAREIPDSQKRMGIVLVNEAMQVVDNDKLFEKAWLTESLLLLVNTTERTKDIQYIRDLAGMRKALKQCRQTLTQYRDRFEQLGAGIPWRDVMVVFPSFQAALQESLSIITRVHEEARKALGYSFAIEFVHDDALQLREARKAFTNYMNAAYKLALQRVNTNGRILMKSLKAMSGNANLKAIHALAVMDGIQQRLVEMLRRFEITDVVPRKEWDDYHRKVELAHKIGWPIARQ